MDPTALPAAALQHPPDRVGEALVGIADHELDPSESSLFQRAYELAPEGLALAVADLETKQFSAAIGVHAHGDDDGSGADLHRPAQAAVQVGGIQIQVGVAADIQRPAEKRLHLHVDVSADATHLGFGDPALAAQGGNQGIDLAGGDTGHVGLHHHGVEGLIHTPAGLEDRGQEAAATQLGDLQINVTHLGGEYPGPVAVAVANTLLSAFMAIGAEHGSDLQLNQLLQAG